MVPYLARHVPMRVTAPGGTACTEDSVRREAMAERTRGAIGCIGVGQMGMGMARHLLAAGYDVLAYDVATRPTRPRVGRSASAS